MRYEEYRKHDAVSLADLVRRREVTPLELVACAIDRIEVANSRVNAVIHRLYDRARVASVTAAGPLAGVPFLVKDLDGTLGGAPLELGCKAMSGYVAPYDSELFARYAKAGLLVVGKTNTPEFGILAVTEPELHGATRNPWSLDHTPGGSSGGSAAAVAAGMVPAAHAGDGGGSIRIPASACGLFGLKPTRGRMPLGPDVSEGWNGFVVPHVVSRTVRDSAALLDATHGPDVGAPYVAPAPPGPFLDEVGRAPGKLRVALTTRSLLGENTHPACGRAAEDTARALEALGHTVTEETLPIDPPEVRLAYLTIIAAGVAEAVRDVGRLTGKVPQPSGFEPSTWFLAQVAAALTAAELEGARSTVFRTSRRMGAFFERYDLLVTPTLAHPPARVGELALKPFERVGLAALRAAPSRRLLLAALHQLAAKSLERTPNTMLFNMTGQPAMSLPLAWEGELPIGVQIVGRFGDEATLFRVAGQLEAERPWRDRRPALG